MPTQAVAAYGCQLKIGATVIPELVTITGIGAQFGTVDTSAHDGNGWTSKIPTLLDGGDIGVTLNAVLTNATHILLRTTMLARTSTAFSIVFPGGSPTWTFNAFITRYRIPGAPVNGALQLDVQLTVDGVLTFA